MVHEGDMSSGDAVGALLENKPELRREIAANLYKDGEVSLWKAPEIAHANLGEFRDVLSRRGIKIKASGRKEALWYLP